MTSAASLPRLAASLALSLVIAGCASPPIKPDPPRLDSLRVSDGPSCLVPGAATDTDMAYCQAVRVGNSVHVSGVVASGPMDLAIDRAYAALGQVLKANGLAFSDIVKEKVYTTDLDAFAKQKTRRKAFYGEALPATTWVKVERIYQPAYVIELEVTAEPRPAANAHP